MHRWGHMGLDRAVDRAYLPQPFLTDLERAPRRWTAAHRPDVRAEPSRLLNC
jgi:hypothetical protein